MRDAAVDPQPVYLYKGGPFLYLAQKHAARLLQDLPFRPWLEPKALPQRLRNNNPARLIDRELHAT
jgi:hypothetical protein